MPWHVSLPRSREETEVADRRARRRIPERGYHRPKRQLARDMLDVPASVGLRPAVLVADTAYGVNADCCRTTALGPVGPREHVLAAGRGGTSGSLSSSMPWTSTGRVPVKVVRTP
ncbi:transposase [Streptomyces sp. BE308]|uniref:transposase n=1 Tax=Streptomyces sp. BE308 TaxID=3002529 RepID=UPI002E762377|nr:transposase [Streptomyces sp. BE308]MEE1792313.1 transposase [Streptomyces sp. BE308]